MEYSYLDHVGRNESNATIPCLRRIVEHIVHPQFVILSCELVHVFFQQNVLRVDVGEDQIHLRLVTALSPAHNSLDDLQHWSNTSTTSDHAEPSDHIRCVDHGALWTFDLHRVTNLQRSEMSADVAIRVGLDKKVKVAELKIGGNWRV